MRILFFVCLVLVSSPSWAFSGDGNPFKYISSCEIDLNGDKKADKALLIEGISGRELIVLIATETGYDTHVVSTGKGHMFLNCKFGTKIKETIAGSGKGKEYKVPGAYLELVKAESSAVAYIWQKGSFKEVWTAD